MDGKVKIGRVALREEGEMWNAYYALPDTMDDAIFLGSIKIAAVKSNPERKEEFIALMRGVIGDLIKEQTGFAPSWKLESAPEHERAGRA